ncbi:hypothetical protein ABZY90_11225 [Streptomyces sp. NPDC006422]|uniref:hypothetical protein n=1 Tax=unclassified Streptomyces TaxID=2593676 RepID=UPI0033AF357F
MTNEIQEVTPPTAEGDTPETEATSPNAEDAKYRKKLRAAESALEAAQERINELLRREIELLASESLAVGADLFEIGGAAIESLVDDKGNVSPSKVKSAAEALLKKRPGLRNSNAGWGDVGGAQRRQVEIPQRVTMRDALRKASNKN